MRRESGSRAAAGGRLVLLLLLALAAIGVHGYHPAVEDGEIYLPGIKKDLNPALYPFGDQFFMSHAGMTLFDETVAGSVRISRLPFDYAIFLWHLGCIFLLLWACWRVGHRAFGSERAAWGGAALVASLLTIPVAGTALYLVDQYLTPRDLSTAGIMLAIAEATEKRWGRAAVWIALLATIHPLMSVFGAGFLGIWWLEQRHPRWLGARTPASGTALGMLLPLSFKAPSSAYRASLETRPYFFLQRWAWYEWLGIFAPLALVWWLGRWGRKRGLETLDSLSRTVIVFGLAFFAGGLVLMIPALAGLALLQPMRSLHLVYLLLFVLLGGVLAETVLQNRAWRWLALFVPLCAGMFYAQRQLFPASPHLELPGRPQGNRWAQAFDWIRGNTPVNAIFALDPEHMALPGEDQHGFRALAERSMLADAGKDSGAVSMFPAMAEPWQQQVEAQRGWRHFGAEDFQRLERQYGVSWVVLERGLPFSGPGEASRAKLSCPYENEAVMVCRIEN